MRKKRLHRRVTDKLVVREAAEEESYINRRVVTGHRKKTPIIIMNQAMYVREVELEMLTNTQEE